MKMTQNGVRPDAHLRATMKECSTAKRMLEAGANSGDITPQEYCGMLETLIKKDLMLINYFQKVNDAHAQKFIPICKARWMIVKKELQGMRDEGY